MRRAEPTGWRKHRPSALADIRAAIVDLDGTMVDTQGDFVVALNLTLAELGLSGVDRAFVERTVGKGSEHLLRTTLATRFSDAQCGFKAVSRRVIEQVVPDVRDDSWFFDTELLAVSEKRGYRIKDVPVRWVDDDDSRVKILATALEDIRGVLRVRRFLRHEASATHETAR